MAYDIRREDVDNLMMGYAAYRCELDAAVAGVGAMQEANFWSGVGLIGEIALAAVGCVAIVATGGAAIPVLMLLLFGGTACGAIGRIRESKNRNELYNDRRKASLDSRFFDASADAFFGHKDGFEYWYGEELQGKHAKDTRLENSLRDSKRYSAGRLTVNMLTDNASSEVNLAADIAESAFDLRDLGHVAKVGKLASVSGCVGGIALAGSDYQMRGCDDKLEGLYAQEEKLNQARGMAESFRSSQPIMA